jgi:hypothetical protein
LQPRQKAKIASSPAATTMATRNATPAASTPNPSARTAPVPVIAAPIACAKRFGGPDTSFGGPSRGAATFVANSASGLSDGPATTRSTKPTASTASSHSHPVASAMSAIAITQPATTRAAFSLTVAGKEKTSRTQPA